MTTVTLIIQEPPYGETNKAWDALRLAGAALAEDMRVRLFLLSRGVDVGRHDQNVPDGKPDLEALLKELMECGLKVLACGKCLTECDLDDGDMIDGITRGSMRSLAGWVKTSTHVLTF